jgi:hypothetical protein
VVTVGDWTALSERLADDILEPGFGAAEVFARAYRAGADLAGVRGLVGAALALTEGRALHAACAYADPCKDQVTLVSWTENLEAHVAALLKRCEDHGRAARDEHDAVKARAMALSAASAASAEDAQAEARARAEEAERVIADCEGALEVLGDADCKLRYARDLLRAVPSELAEVYEAPIALTARGGRMPHSGDFIAPAGPPETIAGRGAA